MKEEEIKPDEPFKRSLRVKFMIFGLTFSLLPVHLMCNRYPPVRQLYCLHLEKNGLK